MVQLKDRTHSKLRQRKRTPGGKLKVYRVNRRVRHKLLCSECKNVVHGTRLDSTSRTARMPSRKNPELCATCSRKKMIKAALEGELNG